MIPIPLIVGLSLTAAGAVIYAISFRTQTWPRPIISPTGKKFIGGALLVCAAVVLAYWFLKRG